MKIDCHCHAFPLEGLLTMEKIFPELIEVHQPEGGKAYAVWAKTPLPAWNGQDRIQKMDIAGIDMEVLQNPILYHKVDEHAPELCQSMNNALAQACAEHPDRLRFLACVPLNDMGECVREIARAHDALGAAGIVIPSNVNGTYFDDEKFLPFWKEITDRNLAVMMHPLYSSFYKDDEGPTLLAFPFDTTLSATKIVLGGIFEKFPTAKVVLSHMGGALPYMARRIDVPFEVPSFLPGYADRLEKLPTEYMKNFYLDTALNWNASAFACARDLVGIDHMLIGSDFFIETTDYDERTVAFINSLGLSEEEYRKVFSENLTRVMNI